MNAQIFKADSLGCLEIKDTNGMQLWQIRLFPHPETKSALVVTLSNAHS